MKTSTLILLLSAASSASAFGVVRPLAVRQAGTASFMADAAPSAAAEEAVDGEDDVPSLIVVNGKNIELTPAINDYVEKKIGETLKKLASRGFVRECDVILSVNKNKKVKNRHRVDLNANLKGLTIHCKEESSDMYASIDAVSHALNRKLRKYKERRDQGFHAKNSMGEDIMTFLEAFEEEQAALDTDGDAGDEFVDPEAPTITKVNSYDLKHAISLEEGVFALDYVDHDFFVFKNEDTDRVNIVYKRTLGDVGVIEV